MGHNDPIVRAHRTVTGQIDGLEIRAAHAQREWMNMHPLPPKPGEKEPSGTGFANRCLPLLMGNQLGWTVHTMAPIVATSTPEGTFLFDWSTPSPRVGAPMNNFSGNVMTWPLPWVFETPVGWDMLVMPPTNVMLPAGATCLTALVETDHSPVTFTINWHVEPGVTVFLNPGDVIAQLVPYPTEQVDGWSLEIDDVTMEGHPEWTEKRATENAHMDPSPSAWQKLYWNSANRRKIKKDGT